MSLSVCFATFLAGVIGVTGGEGDFVAKQITDVPAPQIAKDIAEEQAAPSRRRLAQWASRSERKSSASPRHQLWKKSQKAVKVLLRELQEEFMDSLPCHR